LLENGFTQTRRKRILLQASRELYYIDEGEKVVDRNLLLGHTGLEITVWKTSPGSWCPSDTLRGLLPNKIVERVKNCNRPGRVRHITTIEAEDILRAYKEASRTQSGRDGIIRMTAKSSLSSHRR
jgi:hypothetical protein